MQNINQSLCSQKTPHTSSSQASYGVSIVRVLETIDRIVMALHCIMTMTSSFYGPSGVISDSMVILLQNIYNSVPPFS